MDYARLFCTLARLSDRARAGAMSYATHPSTPLLDIQRLVVANPGALEADLAATVELGLDGLGNSTVQVTVMSQFETSVTYPGIPDTVTLSRKVVMMVGSL
ncbi:unnamed protein product [Phaeothamnion confervicola]